jgi:5'-nucleotidase/UDP-sugar diphosphatase
MPRRALLAAPLLLPASLSLTRPRRALASAGTDLLLILLADLHSCYDRHAALLAAIDAALAAQAGVPAFILVNGDVFERGNAVALRSGGAADWALLAALRARAPVLLNIGNHETALLDDLAEVVARCRALGLTVLSNILDTRSRKPFTDYSVEIPLRGERRMTVVGIATDEMATYRAAARPWLQIPPPTRWAHEVLPWALAETDLGVVMSHAGVAADKPMLQLLPAGSLLLGGHEHLRFAHAQATTRYVHPGAWGAAMTIASVSFGPGSPQIDLREVGIDPAGPQDPAQAALLQGLMAAHLTEADREVVATLAAPLPLPRAGRWLAGALARAGGAAAGVVANTTLGTGLPAGPVSRYQFDAFIRFDGEIVAGEADAASMAAIGPRANQDDDRPLAARSGEFVYADALPAGPARLASIGWVRANEARYLGTSGIDFQTLPGPGLKAMAAAALRG